VLNKTPKLESSICIEISWDDNEGDGTKEFFENLEVYKLFLAPHTIGEYYYEPQNKKNKTI